MWKKVKKLIFLELQVGPAISQTLYELETSGLAYSTHNHYLIILHYPWLGEKSKLFSRVKNVKRSFFETPTSTDDFLDPIRARDFRIDLFNSL